MRGPAPSRSRRAIATALALLVTTLAFPTSPAAWAAPDDARVAEARRLVLDANALFQLGKVSEALPLYEKAYRLRPTPNTLFNVAQCYRELGQLDRALFSYRSYLVTAPGAQNREEVEALIKELEEAIRKQRHAAGQPPKGVATPEQKPEATGPGAGSAISPAPTPATSAAADGSAPRPWYRRWYLWAAIGAAIVGGAVGGAVGASRGAGGPPGTDLGNMAFTFGGR